MQSSRARLRSARLLGGIALSHLADSPAQALVLAGMRSPDRIRPALTLFARAASRVPGLRWLEVWDLVHSGAVAAATDLIQEGSRGARPWVAGHLADVAVSIQRPGIALGIARQLPEGPRRRRLVSRSAWAAGHASAAVDALTGTGRRERAARSRALGELQVLRGMVDHGWGGEDPSTTGHPRATGTTTVRRARARGGTVLHLLTNSLPHTRSGYTLRTHALLSAIRCTGWEPITVTRLMYPVSVGRLAAATVEQVDEVPYVRLLPRSPASTSDLRLLQQTQLTASLVERYRPDVIHATTHFPNGLVARELSRRYSVPFVYEVRGFLEETWVAGSPDERAGTERYLLSRERETECMLAADHVVTLAEVMKDEIVRRGVPTERVSVAPNAVDAALLATAPPGDDLRIRLGFSPHEVVLGTVTSVVAYEGLSTLVEAAGALRRAGLPVRVLVVGDGADRRRLERTAAERYPGMVVFTGRVPHAGIARYHRCIDVFVVPRCDERVCRLVTPLKPIEAMACGVPVVVSDLPALRELLPPGDLRTTFEPDSADDLARTLHPLVIDPALRADIGLAGHTHVAATRTWAGVAAVYARLYESLGVPLSAGSQG